VSEWYVPYQPDAGAGRPRPPVTVRAAREDDLPAFVASAGAYVRDDPAVWERRFRRELARRPSCMITATIDGAPVGFARAVRFRPRPDAPANVVPAGWYLLGVAVHPDHLRRGAGRALTLARLRWLSRRTDEAWYFTNSRNTTSVALHERLGFREHTRDFTFPGAVFPGGEGVLFRKDLTRG
jgi:ribosomal protein S18 acetylase RimI-like enzyme